MAEIKGSDQLPYHPGKISLAKRPLMCQGLYFWLFVDGGRVFLWSR